MDKGAMKAAMDQGVSYEAIEGLKYQKAIKVVMDLQQAMDQGIRYGSRIRWIREQ